MKGKIKLKLKDSREEFQLKEIIIDNRWKKSELDFNNYFLILVKI